MPDYQLQELRTDFGRGTWQAVYAFRKQVALQQEVPLAFSSWRAMRDQYLRYLNNGMRILRVWQDQRPLGFLTLSHKRVDGIQYAFLKYDALSPYLPKGLLLALLPVYLAAPGCSGPLVIVSTDPGNDYLETLLPLEISETRTLFDLHIDQTCRQLITDWRSNWELVKESYYLSFTTAIPDHLLEEFCALVAAVNADVKYKSRLFDATIFSPTGTIKRQQALKSSGTHQFNLLLFTRHQHRLIGYTDVTLHPADPSLAYQNMTGIHKNHRNRGLAKVLKATMLKNLIARFPDLKRINTAVHPGNLPSQRLNRNMGYQPVGTYKEYIIPRSSIVDFLDGGRTL